MIVPGTTVDGTEPLAFALARAFRWQKYIDEGKFRNSVALANAIGLDKSVVAKILRLRFLSPAIVHRIVTGDIPRSLTLSFAEINAMLSDFRLDSAEHAAALVYACGVALKSKYSP